MDKREQKAFTVSESLYPAQVGKQQMIEKTDKIAQGTR